MIRLLCIAITFALASPAHAAKRVALVIGIDKYDNLSSAAQLKRARSDAAAVALTLKELKFEVIAKEDVSRSEFNSVWQDFLNRLAPGDTAAFYFAGHGVELGGRNYLLPRDVPHVRPGRDEFLKRESLSVHEFLTDLREKDTGLNIVILDACRDNPFELVAGRSVGGSRGLAITEPPEGVFIMYSAASGETALDRTGDDDPHPNSVYTRHLLPLLKANHLSLTEVAEEVRISVRKMAATVRHRQTPAYYNQANGRICLGPGEECSARVIGVSNQSRNEAMEVWGSMKDTTSIPELEMFIEHYKDTFHAKLARSRIEALKKQQVAVDAPPAKSPPPGRCDGVEVVVAKEKRCLHPARGNTEWFKDCPTCPEMVVVPAGTFTMGSPEAEQGRDKHEGPERRVTIRAPFAVGRFAVTFDEWGACEKSGGCGGYGPSDEGWGRERRPVINVSWNDATAYIEWLSKTTGKAYRLLSEAEREYITRAGTTTQFWWGKEISANEANYFGPESYSTGPKGEFRHKTLAVDSFSANPWGVYQVHGNVWEWVLDCWNDSYKGAPKDGAAWTAGNCSQRVFRGGAWGVAPTFLRAAARNWNPPARRTNSIGFRVARILD